MDNTNTNVIADTNVIATTNDSPSVMNKITNYIDIIISNKMYLFIAIGVVLGIVYYIYTKKYIKQKKNKEDETVVPDTDVDTEVVNKETKLNKKNKEIKEIKESKENQEIKEIKENQESKESKNLNEIIDIQKYLLEQNKLQQQYHQDMYQQIVMQQQMQQQMKEELNKLQQVQKPVPKQVPPTNKVVHPKKNESNQDIETDSDSVNLSDNELESLKKQLAILQNENNNAVSR